MRKFSLKNCAVATAQLILFLFVVTACGGKQGASGGDASLSTELYVPAYAEGFRILGDSAHESVIIESINPWQGADSVVRRLFIARGGESVPDGFDGEVLQGDAQRIVTMSSTQIAMLDAMGEVGRVAGVSVRDFICCPAISANSDIVDVGYEGDIDYEKLLGINPDLVMLYGVNGPNPMESKLKELNIPFIYIGDYLEQSPLGKSEWIVAVAEAVGLREKGVAAFEPIPQRYNSLKAMVDTLRSPRPKVMINAPYGDSWFMPSEQSYAIRLIRDAGGVYPYRSDDSNASRSIDLEQAYLLASQSDVWINTGDALSKRDLLQMCPKMGDTKPIVSSQLYNNNLRRSAKGGNDYWEGGIMHPDLILRDLIKIFHPEALQADTLVYYRRLQ
jgi:iron complex transport system substrate-binding protein